MTYLQLSPQLSQEPLPQLLLWLHLPPKLLAPLLLMHASPGCPALLALVSIAAADTLPAARTAPYVSHVALCVLETGVKSISTFDTVMAVSVSKADDRQQQEVMRGGVPHLCCFPELIASCPLGVCAATGWPLQHLQNSSQACLVLPQPLSPFSCAANLLSIAQKTHKWGVSRRYSGTC